MTEKKTYPTDYSAIYVPKYNLLVPRKVADVVIAYIEDRESKRRKMRVTQSKALKVFRNWIKETYPKLKVPTKSLFWYTVGSIEFGKAVPIKAEGLYEFKILKPELLTDKQKEELHKEAIRQGIILPQTAKIPEEEVVTPEEIRAPPEEERLAPEIPEEEKVLPSRTELVTITFNYRISAEYSPKKGGGSGKGDIDIEVEFSVSVDVPKELWDNPTVRNKIIEQVNETVQEATSEFFEQDYAIKRVFEAVGKEFDLEPQLEKWDISDHFYVDAPPTEISYSADVEYVTFARANRVGERRVKKPYYASQLLDRLEEELVDVESTIESYVSQYYMRR